MAAMDSKQAHAYLIDPLNAPEPSQETGPGSSFLPKSESTVTASPSSPASSTNPFRRSSAAQSPVQTGNGYTTHSRQASREFDHLPVKTHSRQTSREFNNGPSTSPRTDKFPNYREEVLGGLNEGAPPRRSNSGARPPSYDVASGSRRRGSSLKERFPGDDSNKPLDILRRDSKKAYRSPHLSRRQIPGADMIDRLDPTVNKIPYHHEGPYDAALLSRNTDIKSSPVAALKESNAEALKATSSDKVKDAVEKHKPLDGVADVPPGMTDKLGRRLDYEEGTNEFLGDPQGDNRYKKYDGIEYRDDDVRGQGEPSYSLDRALQNHTIHERNFDGQTGIEMSDRPLMSDYDKSKKDRKSIDARDPVAIAGDEGRYADLQHAADVDAHPVKRHGSLRDGLKRRFGSIKKKGLDEYLP